jgi:arsenate reductase
MPGTITIYHNPRCTKSRQTLKLIEEQGITPEVVLYLETPPTKSRLKDLIKMLKIKPIDLVRRSEDPAKKAGVGKKNLTDEQLIDLMVKHPVLIERPIVTKGRRAILARPPENVLDIL